MLVIEYPIFVLMMKKKKITIVDVAKKLGVSTSTVSRALQDHHSISLKTKKLVRKAAEQLNYSPNNVAASLRRGKVNSIGIIVPRINSRFISNCISGMEKITYPAGFNLIICQSSENYEKEVHNVKTLIDSQVSGIIISISNETFNTKHLKDIISSNIPLVMFDRVDNSLGVDCVVNEDIVSSCEAICHFYDQGYRKIAILSGPRHLYVYKNRIDGYLKSLKEFNLQRKDEWLISELSTKEQAYLATQKLFKNSKEAPDAIFCTGDEIALGAIQYLKDIQKSIPKDVGVIGYSNDNFSSIISPSLTSIEQYPADIGSHAASIILDLLGGSQDNVSTNSRKNIIIAPKLIIRESSNRKGA